MKLINVISDPRSSGCTRNNNETIAFLRKMVEIGAPIIKIYAKEEILDPSMKDYPNQTLEWKYALTKNLNHSIDRTDVLKFLKVSSSDLDSFWEAKRNGGSVILDPASPINQILEVGSYQMDAHPDVITYTPGDKLSKMERKIGRKGNVYGIKDKEMHGVYYIDAGVMENYAHPDSVVETGGFSDEVTPGWMMKSNLK